jgi:hypothetical protein
VSLIEDRNAKKRSKMMQQKSVCNGEATGFCCAHYWWQVSKVESNNADILVRGETQRACLLVGGQYLKMEEDELAVECNRYVKDTKQPYRKEVEEYSPITPEEYKELQKEFPSEQPELKPPTVLPVMGSEFKSLGEGLPGATDDENETEPASAEDISAALESLGDEDG